MRQDFSDVRNKRGGHREFSSSPDDPAVYRIFVSFLRGAFEGGLPPTSRLALLDARRIAAVSEAAINQTLFSSPCVIVGRGLQYFLRNRKDVFRTFLYASRLQDPQIDKCWNVGRKSDH